MEPPTPSASITDVDLDRGASRIAAILTPLIGGMVYVVQPGFVQGLTQYVGFTDKQAGYLTAAEMAGIACASITLTLFSHRLHWRRTLLACFLLELTGNAVSMLVRDLAPFAIVRFAVGLGSGGAISLGFALIGMTHSPERNFGWNIGLAGLYGAVVMFALPTVLGGIGFNGFLLFFVACAAVGVYLVRFLPTTVAGELPAEGSATLTWAWKGPALSAILLYFTAQGGVWAYLFLIGTAGGLSEAQVATALTWSGIAGIFGGFTPALIGNRVGRVGPLVVGIVAGLVPMLYLKGPEAVWGYTVGVCVYNFAWNMTHPFLLATYASFDRTGRVVVYATALQTIGMAIGPAVAATLIHSGDYSPINWLAIVLFVATLAMIVPAGLHQARRVRAGNAAVVRSLRGP
jgi:predicted MFS family arabinose efflux permease